MKKKIKWTLILSFVAYGAYVGFTDEELIQKRADLALAEKNLAIIKGNISDIDMNEYIDDYQYFICFSDTQYDWEFAFRILDSSSPVNPYAKEPTMPEEIEIPLSPYQRGSLAGGGKSDKEKKLLIKQYEKENREIYEVLYYKTHESILNLIRYGITLDEAKKKAEKENQTKTRAQNLPILFEDWKEVVKPRPELFFDAYRKNFGSYEEKEKRLEIQVPMACEVSARIENPSPNHFSTNCEDTYDKEKLDLISAKNNILDNYSVNSENKQSKYDPLFKLEKQNIGNSGIWVMDKKTQGLSAFGHMSDWKTYNRFNGDIDPTTGRKFPAAFMISQGYYSPKTYLDINSLKVKLRKCYGGECLVNQFDVGSCIEPTAQKYIEYLDKKIYDTTIEYL
tara:strand:+ start:113 stop:1294 length:1182 start_codon:yes stop_codon:yes gene_type:complete